MTHHLRTVLALSAVVACGGEQSLDATDAVLTVSPALSDAETLAVGASATLQIQVDHQLGGSIDLTNIVANNIDGDYFSYQGATHLVLDRGGQLLLDVVYQPLDVGYHRADIEIVHSGQGNSTVVEVRGRAILPDATIFPLGIDFGPVDVGDDASRSLTIENTSDLDLVIDDFNVSNSVFQLDTSLPITVGAGNQQVLALTFTPIDDNPATGNVTLRAGEVPLRSVALRGNDCENGTPTSYDQDNDGFTTCGGDCADHDRFIRPGAVEEPNYADEDCDGTIDEGTVYYDDDGDGFCDDDFECSDGSTPGDCNDGQRGVKPGPIQDEIMDNGVDDNCDGIVDAGTTDFDADGYSPGGGDCDDYDATVYPDAPELPDGKNNDCDTFVDEGTILYDDDGDGYCEHDLACTDPQSLPGDCDDDTLDQDGNAVPDGRTTNPAASELADWRDNDCDGTVDEGTVNYDDDDDGYTERGGDCDDTDPLVSPAYDNC